MPLDLTLKPSKIFYSYLGIVFCCSLLSLYIADALPLYSRFILLILLVLLFFVIVRKNTHSDISHLILLNPPEWEIVLQNNTHYKVHLSGECIVTYFLIWLNFSYINSRSKTKTFHVLLFPDSAQTDLLRQLRARLRFMPVVDEDDETGAIF
jgi:hypothetical protein